MVVIKLHAEVNAHNFSLSLKIALFYIVPNAGFFLNDKSAVFVNLSSNNSVSFINY